MSAMSFAKQAVSAFNREKPHSSVTDWVEILTSSNYEDEALDGIPELVEAINLQPTGPTEASRAFRKKLKHGDVHRQYRALVLLKATVENGGERFQNTFADGQLTDALRHLQSDPGTDPKVKRKLLSVLALWHREFQGNQRMSSVTGLYKTKTAVPNATYISERDYSAREDEELEKRRREEREAKDEAKRKAKEERAEKKRKEEEARKRAQQDKFRKRIPFDFEKERPQILNAIAETSQAANNFENSLTLSEDVKVDPRIQGCLENMKLARKRVVRYIQLVENEEMIGTLLETNERVIAALQKYDTLLHPPLEVTPEEEIQAKLAAASLYNSELGRLQVKQRAAVERSMSRRKKPDPDSLHPDLQDLSFGELGAQQRNLPPPLQPSVKGQELDDDDNDGFGGRGSLSDFSDYESSDEETHNAQLASSSTSYGTKPTGGARNYVYVSDDDEFSGRKVDKGDVKKGLLSDDDDPFADPFAD